MEIKDKILFLRDVYLNMKQTKFASLLNVTRQTIAKWEAGYMKPSLSSIQFIAEQTGVTTDYLIDEEIKELELSARDISDVGYEALTLLIKYFEEENKNEDS